MQRAIEQDLLEEAGQKFGGVRTEELKPDIEKVVADLKDIRGYPLTIEDEL